MEKEIIDYLTKEGFSGSTEKNFWVKSLSSGHEIKAYEDDYGVNFSLSYIKDTPIRFTVKVDSLADVQASIREIIEFIESFKGKIK